MRSCVCARNSKRSPAGDRFPSHLQQRFLCSHLCARYWSGTWMRSPPCCATQNEVREIYSGRCGNDRSTKDRRKGEHCRSNYLFARRLPDARSLTRKNHQVPEQRAHCGLESPAPYPGGLQSCALPGCEGIWCWAGFENKWIERKCCKLFCTKSSRIPPSLRYGATFPGSRTRRSSKSEGGFRRSRRILLRHVRFRGRRRTGQNSSLFKRLQFAVLPLLHFLIL